MGRVGSRGAADGLNQEHLQDGRSTTMRLLLLGHGRMGTLVEALATDYGFEVRGVLDDRSNDRGEGLAPGRWPDVEVAIDFSIGAAVEDNVRGLAALGINIVIGTTGWDEARPRVREMVERSGIGVVAAPNFSTGAILFGEIAKAAGRLLAPHDDYGAYLHELHHAAKRDAPSGTALSLKAAMESSGYGRPIDIAATRAGSIPGTHTIGFDGPSETITLTHTVRDRGTFARGALIAARWVIGRRGWFTMHDVLGLTDDQRH
jgi:4-hydroxy-tetrahydrodipicolinate reductase